MSEFDDAAPAPMDKKLGPFWRCRFLMRCRCGREGELWVWQTLHPRGWSAEMTWRQLAMKLRCSGCDGRAPEIRIPGFLGAASLPTAGYLPPN